MFSQRVKYAIQILAEFEKAKRDGVRLSKRYFQEQCNLNILVVSQVLRSLCMGSWVSYVGREYFSIRDNNEATLYDLLMVVDGGISMDSGIHDGWAQHNRTRSSNARAITDRVTANFINELRNIKLNEMFDCYQVTDHRTLMHMRRNSRNGPRGLLTTRK